MSRVEFLDWMEFYEMSPFDDLHRYHRPAGLVAQSMGGGDMREMLVWLQDEAVDETDADLKTMRAFGFTKKGGG